ncbi:MAG: carboxypeptidase-like regulatory domain-containing protein, partial [Chitinophagales bacterium]|nr:carboxypeptidase-like regulatory domain-containing protein [Chitinophagales bacterium]
MKRLFTSLLTLMSVYALSGQSGTIRGFVYDIENGEPVPFVNVIVMQSDNIGAASDENGFFSIPEVPVGAQRLILTYIGYDTLIHPITVEAGQIYNVKLNMTQSGISLSTVTVSSKV